MALSSVFYAEIGGGSCSLMGEEYLCGEEEYFCPSSLLGGGVGVVEGKE